MRRNRRIQKCCAWVLLIGVTLSLTGCWDRRDPEKMAWVTAIGIDPGPRNDYLFTFQVAAVASRIQGGGKGAGPGGDVYTMEAPDILTAIDGSQAFVARRVNLDHAKVVVIGEEIAKHDVSDVLQGASRFYQFRRNMTVLSCKGRAVDFLNAARPRLEQDPSRWYDLLLMARNETGFLPLARLFEFLSETQQPGVGATAVLVASRPDVAAETEPLGQPGSNPNPGAAPPTTGSSQAGNIRRANELPVEFMGTAVFAKNRLAGYLNGDETRLVGAVRGELHQASMAMIDPTDPAQRIIFRFRARTTPRLKVTRRGNQVHAEITVLLNGNMSIQHTPTNYTLPANRAKLEAAVQAQLKQRIEAVLEKTLHEWNVDIFRIGTRLKPAFATLNDWYAFNWADHIQQTTYNVNVMFKMVHFGMQGPQITPVE